MDKQNCKGTTPTTLNCCFDESLDFSFSNTSQFPHSFSMGGTQQSMHTCHAIKNYWENFKKHPPVML